MKPNQDEFHPFFKHYIELAQGTDLLLSLADGLNNTISFFEQVPEERWHYRYAENKWTPLEILGHISDTERVFQYRLLRIAREDNAVLKSYDENKWAGKNTADAQSFSEVLNNYRFVRQSTIALIKSLENDDMLRTGEVSGNTLSIRAIGWLLCGHEIHHMNIIRERYL